MTAHKVCPDCGCTKASSEFHRNAARLDKLAFYCRECATRRRRESADEVRIPLGAAPAVKRRVLDPGTKWCGDCAAALSINAFGSNVANADGLTAYCRLHHNERGKAFVKAKWGNARHYHLQRRYGVIEADVDTMFGEQNGLCAGCVKKPAKHVDHDHVTGKVRGMLCFTCNVALGNVDDSIETLEALIAYLKKHRAKPLPVAAKRTQITVRIPTHLDYRFTLPRTVVAHDFTAPTRVPATNGGPITWRETTYLVTR